MNKSLISTIAVTSHDTLDATGHVNKKPPGLTYGLEDIPPSATLWISAVQHVAIFSVFMIYPLIIARQAAMPEGEIVNMLQFGCLALGVGVMLQAIPRGYIGSSLLCPATFTGIYLASSLMAVKAGGMPLVWGMTLFAGLVEMGLGLLWARLRPLIPPESAGLVVVLVAAIIGLAALRLLIEGSPTGSIELRSLLVTGVGLAVMVVFNVWHTGRLKQYCVLLGIFAGYVAAVASGMLTMADFSKPFELPLIRLPNPSGISWAFDWSLALPFAIAGLAAAMSTTAVVTAYQRLTRADWVRPDMKNIGRGVLADGIAVTISSLLGTYGISASSPNVGLTSATGVASRVIGFAIAAVLAIIAIQPRLIGLLTIMPRPVMAAAMLFTAAFIMISGIQIISSRVLDSRRTLVIGMGVLTFIGLSVYPNAFNTAPAWAQPVVTSPLVLATLVALGLNLIFRVGIRRRVSKSIDPAQFNIRDITSFIETVSGAWGARRDVVDRLEFAVQQAVEAIVSYCEPKGPITLELSFDEFVIEVTLRYEGTAMDFPEQPPSRIQLLESDDSFKQLAGFLVRQYSDKVAAVPGGIRLHYDH